MKLHSFDQYSHGLATVARDAWITARVKSALTKADSGLGLHIHVKTHAGTVALSGLVDTHRQCEQAMDLARTINGVVDVEASGLRTHVFKPGSTSTPPNAEETTERRRDDR